MPLILKSRTAFHSIGDKQLRGRASKNMDCPAINSDSLQLSHPPTPQSSSKLFSKATVVYSPLDRPLLLKSPVKATLLQVSLAPASPQLPLLLPPLRPVPFELVSSITAPDTLLPLLAPILILHCLSELTTCPSATLRPMARLLSLTQSSLWQTLTHSPKCYNRSGAPPRFTTLVRLKVPPLTLLRPSPFQRRRHRDSSAAMQPNTSRWHRPRVNSVLSHPSTSNQPRPMDSWGSIQPLPT